MENKINTENFTNSAKRFKAKKVILSGKPEVKDKTIKQIKVESEITKSEDGKNTHVNHLKRSRSILNFGSKYCQL